MPESDILEAGGNDSYENIADAQPELAAHDAKVVLVTTDPFHEDRSMAIASDLSLSPRRRRRRRRRSGGGRRCRTS